MSSSVWLSVVPGGYGMAGGALGAMKRKCREPGGLGGEVRRCGGVGSSAGGNEGAACCGRVEGWRGVWMHPLDVMRAPRAGCSFWLLERYWDWLNNWPLSPSHMNYFVSPGGKGFLGRTDNTLPPCSATGLA